MSQTLMLTQALLALLGLFGGTWLLLNPKVHKNPQHSRLAAAINLALAGFLLCSIGISQADDASQLAMREQWATGLALIVFALLPWSLSSTKHKFHSWYLRGNSCVALTLVILNFTQPISLRFNTLANTSLPSPGMEARGSLLLLPYLAFAIATATHLLYRAFTAKQTDAPSVARLLTVTAIILAIATSIETYQITTGTYPIPITWLALILIALTSNASSLGFIGSPTTNEPEVPQIKAEEEKDFEKEQYALLLWLNDADASLASKLLSPQGCTVMREDDASEFPKNYFSDTNVHYSILFNRDKHHRIPTAIIEMAKGTNASLSIIAITQDPTTPRILREIRKKHYQHAIKSPLKATELFHALSSQSDSSSNLTPPYHPYLS